MYVCRCLCARDATRLSMSVASVGFSAVDVLQLLRSSERGCSALRLVCLNV